jgi:hypothetical protein
VVGVVPAVPRGHQVRAAKSNRTQGSITLRSSYMQQQAAERYTARREFSRRVVNERHALLEAPSVVEQR